MMEWGNIGRPSRGDGDQVIYYRRPLKNRQGQPAENPGWITWGDSLSGTKLRDYVRRGFEPLMDFGTINTTQRMQRAYGSKTSEAEGGWTNDRWLWEPILSHPDGPAQFPVSQILAFGWHHPERCPVPDVVFPQLVGKKVKEYRCPERCGRAPFVEYDGFGAIGPLATHLRVMHEWDRTALIAWGQSVGIDFNKPDVGGELISDFSYEGYREKRQAAKPRAQVEVETVG